MSNYYQILHIAESASPDEIKQAYRKMAKKYHPDLHRNDKRYEEQFKLINEAYNHLSDSYKRSIYDHKLAYQRLQNSRSHFERSTASYQSATTYRRKRRPPYRPDPKEKVYDLSNEKKGSLYAFLFVGVVSLIVFMANSIYQYSQEQKLLHAKELLDNKFAQIDSLYFAENITSAMELVRQSKYDIEEMLYAKNYYFTLIKQRELKAQQQYNTAQYDSALLNLLIVYEINNYQAQGFFYQVAICYKNTGKSENAINILEDLLTEDEGNISYLNELGHLYEVTQDDTEKALSYYQKGVDAIFDKFTKTYGEAFRLLISRERIPEYYFDTFWGAGRLYYHQHKFEESTKALEWAIFIKPTDFSTLQKLALAYQHQDNTYRSCKYYQQAKLIRTGYSDDHLENLCQ